MKLIVGLGNPEKKYDGTRHNVGFFVLDELAKKQGLMWQHKDKFKAFVTELPDKSALLIKPSTYYNLVGESVHALADFYKIPPEDILVIHDELALSFGVLRTREKGSDAGNNGMKSIIQHNGASIRRIRIGIANEHNAYMDAADFVLSKFTPSEKKQLKDGLLEQAGTYVSKFLDGSFEPTKVVVS